MNNEQGELVVIGKDAVEIQLNRRPREVRVEFKDEQKIVPCDPQDFDALEFYWFQRRSGHYFLIVKWSVSAVREIVWEVRY
jgi:hypothetical protein